MKLFFLYILLISSSVFADSKLECDKRKLKINRKTLSLNLCLNKSFTSLISKNCLNQKCTLYSAFKNAKKIDYHSAYGNPLYYICAKLGGDVRDVQIQSGKQFKEIKVCSNGNSFVDIGSYFNHYIEKVHP